MFSTYFTKSLGKLCTMTSVQVQRNSNSDYANQTSDEHRDITKKATLGEQSVRGILFYN